MPIDETTIVVSARCNLFLFEKNKAKLRDLIAATGLVILPKLDSTRRFFSSRDLEIIGHLFYITSSFVHHLKPLGEFKLELMSGNAQFGTKSAPPLLPWKLTDDFEIQHLFFTTLSFMIISKPWVNSNWSYSPETLNSGQNRHFFWPVWPWNLMDDLEKQ